jgi:hypothetical protein
MTTPNPVSPLSVFIASFCLSAMAGVASLLRAGKPLTLLSTVSAVLNSGLCGLAISTLWYRKYEDDVYFLIGISILAGLGGTAAVEFVLDTFKTRGITLFGVSFDDKK